MLDIYVDELVQAFSLPGCPLCRVRALDERRRMESFWREGRNSPEARTRFFEAGGFCSKHAWLLHELVVEAHAAYAIADLYGRLADRDLRWLAQVRAGLDRRRRRWRSLQRRRGCPACEIREEAAERKSYFLVEALADVRVRERYERSDGLCFEDFAAAVGQALSAGKDELALYLVDDWARRLQAVRERESWADVIRRYAGDLPGAT